MIFDWWIRSSAVPVCTRARVFRAVCFHPEVNVFFPDLAFLSKKVFGLKNGSDFLSLTRDRQFIKNHISFYIRQFRAGYGAKLNREVIN